MSEVPRGVLDVARSAERVVVLTGAGMSAESGIPTFRGTPDGIWSRFDPARLATPQAWAMDRDLVWGWYLWRVGQVRKALPNAAHDALARWARRRDVHVVTQNVDDLHERAGSMPVTHLHGSLFAFRCDRCGDPYDEEVAALSEPRERVAPPRCPSCATGWVRPGVVWFGESLPLDAFDDATRAVEGADLVLVVGTSGIVYPAAMLPAAARRAGVQVVEVNPDESDISHVAHHVWRATAATALPALVARL
jgi:NAD-dependent deacetylase